MLPLKVTLSVLVVFAQLSEKDMITKEDYGVGMKRLFDILNMADILQVMATEPFLAAAPSFNELDDIQFITIWNDQVKTHIQTFNDRLLELQTLPLFREVAPPNYPEPNL